MFDISWPPSSTNPDMGFGTPGSARGWTFDVTSALGSLDIVATYRHLIALTGDAPVGDLYRMLDIEFTNSEAFVSGSTLTFIADTDNSKYAGDINPIPEPISCALLFPFIFGLIGFGVSKRSS